MFNEIACRHKDPHTHATQAHARTHTLHQNYPSTVLLFNVITHTHTHTHTHTLTHTHKLHHNYPSTFNEIADTPTHTNTHWLHQN